MKLIILLMSGGRKHFQDQAEISKQSINKQIDYYNLNEYIDVYNYIGNQQEQKIVNNTVFLTSKDVIDNTYGLTIECFEYINKNFNYDYIFRTNTSTFINVKLLYEFINFIQPKDTIWCSELYSTFDVKCPNLYDLYPRGNGLVISHKIVDILLENSDLAKNTELTNIMFDNQNIISDDSCIGTILNMYYDNESLNHMKSFTHGWYKCYDSIMNNEGNTLCNWDNENISYDFIKNFITIQVKDYIDKDNLHTEKFNELTNVILSNEYDNKTILNVLNYSLNPSVFLGYFVNPHYVDYNSWYVFHFKNKLNNNN